MQDGAAHQQILQMKGDAGLKMCLTCDAINSNDDLPKYAVGEELRQHVTKEHELTCRLMMVLGFTF